MKTCIAVASVTIPLLATVAVGGWWCLAVAVYYLYAKAVGGGLSGMMRHVDPGRPGRVWLSAFMRHLSLPAAGVAGFVLFKSSGLVAGSNCGGGGALGGWAAVGHEPWAWSWISWIASAMR